MVQTEDRLASAAALHNRHVPGARITEHTVERTAGARTSHRTIATATEADTFMATATTHSNRATFPWRRSNPTEPEVGPWDGSLVKAPRPADAELYPYHIEGGRRAIGPGAVLPVGMGIRHPALCSAEGFKDSIKEFLQLWENNKNATEREALGRKIEFLWTVYTKFRSWVKVVHQANKRRASFMRDNPIRFTVHCPDARMVQVRMSVLTTGRDLKFHLEKRLKTPFLGQKGLVLLFEGVAINDKMALRDAGVRPRSTLILTRRPAPLTLGGQHDDGDQQEVFWS